MSAVTASQHFVNYSKIKSRLPVRVWVVLRLLTLAATVALAATLLINPSFGLLLFWGLALPVLLATFVIIPGFWRQICPMALMNQLPRLVHRSFGRELPNWARRGAFGFAVASFVGLVALRAPLLNHRGDLVGLGILGMLVIAFIGGLLFKGRSGWCGTFCPLGPIQRDYGHAPLVIVRNGYCPTCIGCQKNCYDFNPRAAVFGDVYDDDPAYAGQRRFFMAMMPGLILGYFLQAPNPEYGEFLRALILAAAAATSVGLYQAVISFFSLNPFRAANLFACLALAAFFYFEVPSMLETIQAISGFVFPSIVIEISRFSGIILACTLLRQGWENERIFNEGKKSFSQLSVDQSSCSLRDRIGASADVVVTDKETGTSFPVAPDQTLLEAMEKAMISINFGCRTGLCGADAVIVCEGHDNLSCPTEEELATLRRLGLEGVGRLACMCSVKGHAVIDRDIKNAPKEPSSLVATTQSKLSDDPLNMKGIQKVIIVGNGVAGITVAEALRRISKSVEITILTDEPHHFYNRMAIGRMLYGRTAMDGMFLLPETWYVEHRIQAWRSTVVVSVDRNERSIRLGTGETLLYDRLVLATGADAIVPAPEYSQFSNTFVLRSAADAQAIRMWVQQNSARQAVVIGGGVLGVEAAESLHNLGLRVVLLQRSSRLMDRHLDQNGAQRLARYLANIDVISRTNVQIDSFRGEGKLDALILKDGERIEGDVFLACAGVAPRTRLAQQCGLNVGRGIKVDRFMRTSDSTIYAVGDAAELHGATGGLWPVAAAQATAAVSGMLEKADGYVNPSVLVQLKCDGVDLKSFGDLEARNGDETICAREDDPAWWRLVLREGRLVGAVFVGPPGSSRDLGRVMQLGMDLRPALGALRQGKIEALKSKVESTNALQPAQASELRL